MGNSTIHETKKVNLKVSCNINIITYLSQKETLFK